MIKRRLLAMALTLFGIMALVSPELGVGQDESKKDGKEPKDMNKDPMSKGGPNSKGGPMSKKGGPMSKGPSSGFTPPPPGSILPLDFVDLLKLSDDQKRIYNDLQKEVNDRLEKILTEEQRTIINELKTKGPSSNDPKKK